MCDLTQLDTIFPYPTPKIARIKDARLGLLRYAMMGSIIIYVLGYHIMWKGAHLETQDIAGVHQLQLAHPTKNDCDPIDVECMQNFTGMAELGYCAQSPHAGNIKLPCEYWDAAQLGQLTDQGLMIPTHVSTFYQTPACKPEASNHWTCNGWLYDYLDKSGKIQERRGQASPITDFFIADIERYTLTIDHSVRATMGARQYASEMVGYWLNCNGENQSDTRCTPAAIPCGHKSCASSVDAFPKTQVSGRKFLGDQRSLSLAGRRSKIKPNRQKASNALENPSSEDEDLDLPKPKDDPPSAPKRTTLDADSLAPTKVDHLEDLGVVGLLQGDVFTIGKLLQAANVSLDARRHDVPAWVGGSYRSSGFVLVIRIHYSNIESWLGLKVLPWRQMGPTMHYTHRITKHASHDDFMLRTVSQGGTDDPPHSRVVKEYHGIRVLVEQSGTIALWNNIQLLLILTTTLALMTLTNCITDTVALYCCSESDEYWAIKYERPRTRKGQNTGDAEDAEETTADDDRVMRYDSITM